MRRLLPLLLAGALAGLTTLPTTAQNLCSPSTATTSRAQGYPGSTPYSNSGTVITSNCTGPVIDPGITPDPYAGLVLPVPGYSYGAPTSLLPSGLDAPRAGASASPAGAVAPSSMGGYPGPGPSAGGYPGPGPSAGGYPGPASSTSGYPGPAPSMSGYGGPAPSAGPSGYGGPAPSAGPSGYGGPAPSASPSGYGAPPPGYGAGAGSPGSGGTDSTAAPSSGGTDSTQAPGPSAAPYGAPSAYGYPPAAPGSPMLYGAAPYGGPSAYGYPPAAPYGMGYGPMPGAYPAYPMR